MSRGVGSGLRSGHSGLVWKRLEVGGVRHPVLVLLAHAQQVERGVGADVLFPVGNRSSD